MSVQAWLTREKKKTHYQRLHESVVQETFFQEVSDLLLQGCPELGWDGDPLLKIVHNILFDRLEVVDTHPQYNGRYETLFVTQPGDALMSDPRSMIRRVKQCDHRTRTVDEFLNMLDEQQEAFEKEQDSVDDEHIAEQSDRMAFALMRDVGHLHGGLTRRYS